MAFIDTTSGIGLLITTLTENVTGELFITLFLLVVAIILLAIASRIPIEFTAILVLPLLVGFLAFEQSFLAVAGVGFIYLGVLFAKNFFFYR